MTQPIRGSFALALSLALAGLLGLLSSADGAEETRFVVLGDSQFSHPDVFERMIHEIEMLRPAFVVQVGDLIHGYTYDEETLREEWRRFRSQIAPLTAPFYPVPGNHDVVTPEAETVYGEVWGPDRYHYSFDHGLAHCVVLNSWTGEADDRIEAWQRDWLEADLRALAEAHGEEGSDPLERRSVFVFLHSPLWRYAPDHPGRADWDQVHAVLRNCPVRLVVAGHTHEYVWEERDGIQYVVLNSSGDMAPNERGGFFHGFIHVSMLPGGDVRYGVVKAGSVLPLDTVDSADRRSIAPLALKGGTIRVPGWIAGRPYNGDVTVPLANATDAVRVYRLEWRVPHGVDVRAEPAGLWLEVAPGESRTASFRLTAGSAPPADSMPWLEVWVEETVRTGVVSRDREQQYRREHTQDVVFPTSIALDAPVRFEARHELFVPPEARAARREHPVRVDGKLDEPGWKKASPVVRFVASDGSSPEVGTEVCFLYDEDRLYVAARMEEPHCGSLTAKASPPIPLTWSDDDFELFFDPGLTQNDYVRLFQNTAGTRFNSLPRHVQDRYFESRYESAIAIDGNAWTLEMSIPWSDIAVDNAPRTGDLWGLNIGRHRPQSRIREFQWAGPLYEPPRYGLLRFE